MDDPVRQAAQKTVDEIDRQITQLNTMREGLVNLFGLGVREPVSQPQKTPLETPIPPETGATPAEPTEPPQNAVQTGFQGYTTVNQPGVAKSYTCKASEQERRERHERIRRDVRDLLRRSGGSYSRHGVRVEVGIPPRLCRLIMNHPWFEVRGQHLHLTAAGVAEGAGDGE